jgi:glycosyltransferase involved in cell wall biosynthesis
MPVTVDIVLPCYNPNDRWHLELLRFHETAGRLFHLNYIIVNDGSVSGNISDQIDHLQKNELSIDFISYSVNKGKGFALRRGVAVAMNEYVMYTDIDFPFTDHSCIELLQELVTGDSDVVAGYRDEHYYQNKMTGFRKILSKTFRNFIRKFLKMSVTDTQCGLKGFNRKGREKFLKTKIERYLFDFEFIYSCCRDRSIIIRTIPVQLKQNVQFSKMKLTILFQEAFNLLWVLLFRKSL